MLEIFVRLQSLMIQREKGATAVEYGLFVALIAAVIVGVVVTMGEQVNTAFTTVTEEIATAVGGG